MHLAFDWTKVWAPFRPLRLVVNYEGQVLIMTLSTAALTGRFKKMQASIMTMDFVTPSFCEANGS